MRKWIECLDAIVAFDRVESRRLWESIRSGNCTPRFMHFLTPFCSDCLVSYKENCALAGTVLCWIHCTTLSVSRLSGFFPRAAAHAAASGACLALTGVGCGVKALDAQCFQVVLPEGIITFGMRGKADTWNSASLFRRVLHRNI